MKQRKAIKEKNNKSEGGSGEPQLFQAMVAHWIHEDNLFWTQMRHLILLQLAVFAAWYALGVSVLAVILMLAAAGVSWLIWNLSDKIRDNRDANLDAIKIIAKNLATQGTKETLKNSDYEKWGLFRFAQHSLESRKDAGRKFQRNIFLSCIIADIIASLAVVHDLTCQNGWLRNLHPHFVQTATQVLLF
ncbi:MAG: hypothetical protein WA240_12760 [Nitrospirota bacterium]